VRGNACVLGLATGVSLRRRRDDAIEFGVASCNAGTYQFLYVVHLHRELYVLSLSIRCFVYTCTWQTQLLNSNPLHTVAVRHPELSSQSESANLNPQACQIPPGI